MSDTDDYYYRLATEALDAIRNFPKMPSPNVLKHLKGKFPEDWRKGKLIQTELGLEVVPPKTECELGAGRWDRITDGKWQDAS